MKGLLRKDLYMMAAYCRSFLLIVFGFAIVGAFGQDNWFFIFYPMIVGVMLPVTIQSYDEKFRWERYCGALPVTRAQVVSVKYLLTLIMVGAVFALIMLVQGLRLGLAGRLAELPALIPILLAIGLVGPAILLPIIFRLGVEKGRIAYYILIGVICALGVILSYRLSDTLPEAIGGADAATQIVLQGSLGGTLLTVAVSALIYALSWLLSIRFYQKREL